MAQIHPSDPRPVRAHALATNRVLLAEDDAELRDMLHAFLSRAGFLVECVNSGIGLIQRLAASILDGAKPPADAIVTDVMMPGCNGLNIVEGLRANGWSIPIVVMTAFCDADLRARVASMKGVELLEKPFDGSELERLLHRALTS